MALSEFVSGWNEIIGFKIKVSNLTKPDEDFLTNALLAYLEKLNDGNRPLIQLRLSENYQESLRFKVSLQRAINDIYKKVASPSPENEFNYTDLLKPAPKKTTELLRFLFNYLLFYNQLQNEINMGDIIKERDDKIKNKKKLQTDLEKKSCEAEKIENRIIESQEMLPKLTEKENDLEKKNSELKKSVKDLEESLVEIDLKLISLKQKHNELMEKIIPVEELDKKLAKKSSLKKSVPEALQTAEVKLKENNDCESNIEKLKTFVKDISVIIQLLAFEESLKKKRSLIAQCKDLSMKIPCQKSEKNRINYSISEKSSLLKKMKKKYHAYHEAIKKEKIDLETKIKEADSRILIATNLIKELDKSLYEIEESVEEQERVKKIIERASDQFAKTL